MAREDKSAQMAAAILGAVSSAAFPEFPVSRSPETTTQFGVVEWDGEEIGPFLDLARRLGAPLLYTLAREVDRSDGESDSGPQEHEGETGLIEVSFLKDQVFHRFRWIAEWGGGLLEEESASEEGDFEGETDGEVDRFGRRVLTTEQNRRIVDELGRRGPELIASFVDSLAASGAEVPSPDADWEVRRALVGYLGEVLEIPALLASRAGGGFVFSPDLAEPGTEKALRSAATTAAREIRAKERAVLGPLVQPCVEWALSEEIPLRSLNFSRLQEFLEGRKVRLSSTAVRELRDKVSAGMKRARGSTSHHAPV